MYKFMYLLTSFYFLIPERGKDSIFIQNLKNVEDVFDNLFDYHT